MFRTPEPLRIDLANCELADLPESGFGWVLIERLSSKVVFSRSGGRNHLHICIKTPQNQLNQTISPPKITCHTPLDHAGSVYYIGWSQIAMPVFVDIGGR